MLCEGIVRAKSEVLITSTGTDSYYYNLLEDQLGGVKTRVCRKPCGGYAFSMCKCNMQCIGIFFAFAASLLYLNTLFLIVGAMKASVEAISLGEVSHDSE